MIGFGTSGGRYFTGDDGMIVSYRNSDSSTRRIEGKICSDGRGEKKKLVGSAVVLKLELVMPGSRFETGTSVKTN